MADRLDEAMDNLLQTYPGAGNERAMRAARQAVHDAAREVYAAAIAAREQEVATLRGEAACSTCGGAPHPLGLVCVCGGSNKAWREAQGLREELVRRQMAMGEYPAIPAAWSEITPAALADLRAQLAAREQELWDVRGDLRMTPRQREVVTLVAQGLTYRQVGDQLGIAERTVRMHVVRIARKLAPAGSPWRAVMRDAAALLTA